MVWWKISIIEMELKPAAFITYMGLAYGVLTPAKSLSKAFYSLKKGNAAAERVFEIIDMHSEYQENDKNFEMEEFKKEIEFQDVDFKYDENYVLNKINFKVKKGEMVAIVGASGSGKSTLINLLPRFYEFNNGDILIDGKSIKSLSLKKLRNLISIVTQESILLTHQLKRNIFLGNQNQGQYKLIEASKIANAYEFINEYEEKYKYNVGDNGSNLSGGQKQRIAISRAVISNSPILILDEATSSLDSESEKLVQDALEKLMKNKTSIVIAHRLSTIKNSDKIIVLDSGKIVESGNHDELINKMDIIPSLLNYSHLIKLNLFYYVKIKKYFFERF